MSGLRAEQKMSLEIQNKFCYFVGFVIAVVLSIYHSREDWRLLGKVKKMFRDQGKI